MRRLTNWKIAGGAAFTALVAVIGWRLALPQRERLRPAVRQWVFEASPYHVEIKDHAAALGRLDELGDAAYPFLGEMLLARDTSLAKFYYAKIQSRLPLFLRQRLGRRYAPDDARLDAAIVAQELGPAASRGLVCQLSRALAIAGPVAKSEILGCLLWSAPESAQAVHAISNYLGSARPEWPPADGRARALVERTPEWAPLLANRSGLRLLLPLTGTNAQSFIPALCAVARGPGNGYGTTAALRERIESINVLGKIGKGDDRVASTLRALTREANQETQLAALLALARLGELPEGELLAGLQNAVFLTTTVAGIELDALGETGPGAREALPWIEGFISAKAESGLNTVNGTNAPAAPDWLRLKAIVAAGRVAPDKAARFGPELVSRLGRNPEAFNLLLDLKPCAPGLIEDLAASLPDGSATPILATAVVLAHHAGEAKALGTLKDLATSGAPGQRLDSGYWIWKLAGDAGPFLAQAAEGLAAPDAPTRWETATRLAELGPIARPLGPALQAALRRPDPGARDAAGRALRIVAPELMPPIRECY